MLIAIIFSFGVLFTLLAVGANWVVEAFNTLVVGVSAKKRIVVATVLVALSTSLPEFFVAIASGFDGHPEVSLANLLGANVANLSVVIGGATLIAGSLAIVGDYWRWELVAAFLSGVAPILLMMDGRLSRLDGFILLTIYLLYIEDLIVSGRGRQILKTKSGRHRILTPLKGLTEAKNWSIIKLLLGVGVMAISAGKLVEMTVELATLWQMPVTVLALLMTSLGTTLPELFVSVEAALKKNIALVLGNLLGSVITNATLIIGLLAIVKPFSVGEISNYALANIAFVVIFGLFWLFTLTKRKLDRWEGLILLGIFLIFSGMQLMFLSV